MVFCPPCPHRPTRTTGSSGRQRAEFLAVCNEFWWCLNNVAKGLWRREIPYVQDQLNQIIRPELIRMLSWKAGLATGFACSAGKSGKYLYRFLPERDWNELLATYASARTEEIWKAVFVMCGLFDRVAAEVGAALHFPTTSKRPKPAWAFCSTSVDCPPRRRKSTGTAIASLFLRSKSSVLPSVFPSVARHNLCYPGLRESFPRASGFSQNRLFPCKGKAGAQKGMLFSSCEEGIPFSLLLFPFFVP